jgi:hypothetical protein
VTKDQAEAKKLYERACGADVPVACDHLAVELSKGSAAEVRRSTWRGVPRARRHPVRGRRAPACACSAGSSSDRRCRPAGGPLPTSAPASPPFLPPECAPSPRARAPVPRAGCERTPRSRRRSP